MPLLMHHPAAGRGNQGVQGARVTTVVAIPQAACGAMLAEGAADEAESRCTWAAAHLHVFEVEGRGLRTLNKTTRGTHPPLAGRLGENHGRWP